MCNHNEAHFLYEDGCFRYHCPTCGLTAPHSRRAVYFLTTRNEGKGRARLTGIKDERTGECFACLFVSAQDAEEFMVANDMTFDAWEISQARSPIFIQGYCDDALRDGIDEFVINPPPVIRGLWRTLFVEQLRTWSREAKEPLLAWAGYEVRLEN